MAPPNVITALFATHPRKTENQISVIGQLPHMRYPMGLSGHHRNVARSQSIAPVSPAPVATCATPIGSTSVSPSRTNGNTGGVLIRLTASGYSHPCQPWLYASSPCAAPYLYPVVIRPTHAASIETATITANTARTALACRPVDAHSRMPVMR